MAIRMHTTYPAPGCRLPRRRAAPAPVSDDWRLRLPVLASGGVVLRQLKPADAPALFLILGTEEVGRFISPPPTTLAGFEQFINWGIERQRQGKMALFAVTLDGSDVPVGLFQVRSLDPGLATGEWGFALGSAYWGKGLFARSAVLALGFAFEILGIARLEARSMVANERGNAALRKMGATAEGVLRHSIDKGGQRHDQYLWSLLADDWREQRGLLVPARHTGPTRVH